MFKGLVKRGQKRYAIGLLALPLMPMFCDSPGLAPTNYPLQHDFSLSPGFGEGLLTDCYTTSSEVEGREHVCRVVEGYEELGDYNTWTIFAPFPGRQNPDRILSMRGNDSGYGRTIVLDGGAAFEGCDWHSPNNTYTCDYRVSRHTVLNTDGSATFFLRKMWAWANYVVRSPLACAGGITGIFYGRNLTAPLLADCSDGPM